MILRIRTKDNLESLLRHGNSPAWVVASYRVPKIERVEIYQFDGKKVLKAKFEESRSARNEQGRLVVAFSDPIIESCNFHWIGQNPIQYYHQNAEREMGKKEHWILEKTSTDNLDKLKNWKNSSTDELGALLSEINQACNIQNYPGYLLITSADEIFDELKSKAQFLSDEPLQFIEELNTLEEKQDNQQTKFIKALDLAAQKLHEQGGQIYTTLTPKGGSDTIFLIMRDELFHDELILLAHYNETLNSASGWFSEFISDFPPSLSEYKESNPEISVQLDKDTSVVHFERKEDPFFGETIESNFKVLGWDEEYYTLARSGMMASEKYC